MRHGRGEKGEGRDEDESFIAVDPRNPQHLLATAMVVVNGELHAYPYASFDGGKS